MMRFAIVLAKLLCGLITAGILTAFIYFSITQEQSTGLSPANISILLLTASLMIWALVSMVGDIMRYRIDSKTIKDALGKVRQAPTFISAPENDKFDFSDLVARISETNQQTLAPNFQNINEQLSMFSSKNNALNEQIVAAVTALSDKFLHNTTSTSGTDAILTDSSDATAFLSQIYAEISDLRNQILPALDSLNAQMAQQAQLLQNISTVSTTSITAPQQDVYSHLTEEANYPESVIDYTQNQQSPSEENLEYQISEVKDTPLEDFLSTTDELVEAELSTSESDNAADTDITIPDIEKPTVRFPSETEDTDTQSDIVEEYSTDSSSPSEEITIDLPEEAQQETVDEPFEMQVNDISESDNLGADDPFGAPVDLNATSDDIPASEPDGDDLGADDPFGAPVDLNATSDDIPAGEPGGDNLGADDPFGAPVDLNATFEAPLAEAQQDNLGAANPFGAPMDVTNQYEVPIVEPQQDSLGASDPFGTPIGLRSPFDERDSDNATDLGAADPFGTPTDFADPFAIPESENDDILSADDPFGSAQSNNSFDISAIEPSVNKNEPNLDQIFNDKLASELADLEIMQDSPSTSSSDKDADNAELEQFFASRR